MNYDCLNDWYELPWFTIFIYVSAIVAFLSALYLEYKDLFCPHGGRARYGQGASYEKGRIDSDDTYETILQKIRISSRYDEASIYWRRSIIFTVILLFPLLILLLYRLPTAYEVLVSFIVIYLFTYMMLVYYQTNVSVYATSQVDKGTRKLEKYYKSNNHSNDYNYYM